MADVYEVVKPYAVAPAQRTMGRLRGPFSASLAAGSQWGIGDLVEIISNFVAASKRTTTATNIGRLAFAPGPWDISPLTNARYPDYMADGVPLEAITEEHRVVFTYQDSAADGSNHAFVAANQSAVEQQEQREILYNTSAGAYTIRDGTSQAHVQMIRTLVGTVGDSNVQVLCKILDANRLETV